MTLLRICIETSQMYKMCNAATLYKCLDQPEISFCLSEKHPPLYCDIDHEMGISGCTKFSPDILLTSILPDISTTVGLLPHLLISEAQLI